LRLDDGEIIIEAGEKTNHMEESMIGACGTHSFTRAPCATSASRDRQVELKFFPKELESGVKFSNRSRFLLESINFLLQLGDSNKITLRKPFLKIIPHINSVFHEN
jgi:hypothetical protein